MRGTRAVTPELRVDDAVRQFFLRQSARILEKYDALAIGLGRKMQGPTLRDSYALRVFVEKKTARGTPPPNGEMVEENFRLHTEQGDEVDVPSDVEEARVAVCHTHPAPATTRRFSPRKRVDPLIGGAEIVAFDAATPKVAIGAGTLGGWAWDTRNRRVVLLTNAHVVGEHNEQARTRVIIAQPSAEAIARNVAVRSGSAGFFGGGDSTVDAGVGADLDMSGVDLRVNRISPAIMASAEPGFEQKVEKFGVGTGFTRGTVVNRYWMGYLKTGAMGPNGPERIFFTHCMRIRAAKWADHGDSGALVFARTALPDSDIKPAIGLHFAGEEGSTSVGIACRITEVYRALGLTSLAEGALTLVLSSIPLDGTRAERAAAVLRDLVARVPRADATRALHSLLTAHRALTTDVIIRGDAELTKAAAHVLDLLVGAGQTLADVRNAQLDAHLVSAVRECCERFAERGQSNDFRDAALAVRDLVVSKQGQRIGEALGVTDEPVDITVDPESLRARASLQDVIAYLAQFREELVQRYDAIGAGEYKSSGSTYGIVIARERGKPATVDVPPFIKWKHEGRDIKIPVRVTLQSPDVLK